MKKLGNLKHSLLLVLALFLVGCPPSSVTILAPSDGDHFEVGDEITFTGSAMDPSEGELSDDSLVWRSSINGEIGTGTEFIRDDLSEGTKSFVLIMDDPDAPGGTWNHWIVFNIPPTTKAVQERQEPQGTKGKNSWGNLGYGGPCPPSGTHRYFFTIYALDVDSLSLAEGATKSAVETSMGEHILDQASLMGTYN